MGQAGFLWVWFQCRTLCPLQHTITAQISLTGVSICISHRCSLQLFLLPDNVTHVASLTWRETPPPRPPSLALQLLVSLPAAA